MNYASVPNCTLKGLSFINKGGIESIWEAVRELERAGYVTRSRARDEKGQLTEMDYVIYEKPVFPISGLPQGI